MDHIKAIMTYTQRVREPVGFFFFFPPRVAADPYKGCMISPGSYPACSLCAALSRLRRPATARSENEHDAENSRETQKVSGSGGRSLTRRQHASIDSVRLGGKKNKKRGSGEKYWACNLLPTTSLF